MNSKNKIIWLSCICLLLLSACSTEDQPTKTESVQDPIQQASNEVAAEPLTPAPVNGVDTPLEFTLTDLTGAEVKAADYRGKWLVLNYWATWCGPCRDEMPELVKFQADNKNVQVLGIAYEDADIQKLKNFALDFNVTYPLLTIDVYKPPAFAEEGGLGLPTTIVYNTEGYRHKAHIGPIDIEGLMAMIQ